MLYNKYGNDMNNTPNSKKYFLKILLVLIIVIGLVGVTYSFFNYTRTGVPNHIKVDRIAFNSIQGSTG